MQVIQVLDTHTAPWVTQGREKDLAAMGMPTVGSLTAPFYRLVELMQK